MARGEFKVNDAIVPRRVLAPFALPGTLPATAANWGVVFWVADRPYELVAAKARHATAGSDGGAVTAMLTKVPSGTAAAAGAAMLSAGLNLKATANTNQEASLSATPANLRLAEGDGLAWVLTGTPTAVAGFGSTAELKAI